ncbi:MAG: hypothetical protein HS105_08670 [Chloracidobacterium sp.]|nr:hypothetical protein [Chloracidobacterium sp.]MCO5333535.1 hypothetical protein [Pyrinomonadaceae bacterium]
MTLFRITKLISLILLAVCTTSCTRFSSNKRPLANVYTDAGLDKSIGEPFGVAVKDGVVYFSDGNAGTISRLGAKGPEIFVRGLDTPSMIVFDREGGLLIADSGSHTIKRADENGTIETIGGTEGVAGMDDGDAASATFNAPIGIAVADDGAIFVADTYNDRIRMISAGRVTTFAGGTQGFADGIGVAAQFDTPAGLAYRNGMLLVADLGNRRIRSIARDGTVTTVAGSGETGSTNGSLLSASFTAPTGIAADSTGTFFVTDGNCIRAFGAAALPVVMTVAGGERGMIDGRLQNARFNRPSGIAIGENGDVFVADSDDRLLRRITSQNTGHSMTESDRAGMLDKPEDFRIEQPARWPYDPPDAKRDIAGTLAEIRGLMTPEKSNVWFHNGLDVAGAYGETARFVRSEKVLRPVGAENFGTLRELLRMPAMGYIHIRLGRDSNGIPFGDKRFIFQRDAANNIVNVRVPRGTKFTAGERIGTLNPMNHVHLIAGRAGQEMNAIDALVLPGFTDTRPPVIESVNFYDSTLTPVTKPVNERSFVFPGRVRVVVRAYDQVDGNSERRRLGIYKAGYQIIKSDGIPLTEQQWTLVFDRMPSNDAVSFVYADESHSGATGVTIFNYIVTNRVEGQHYAEDWLDTSGLDAGRYVLRVTVADHSGNTAASDTPFEIQR